MITISLGITMELGSAPARPGIPCRSWLRHAERCGDAGQAQCAGEGRGLPMSVRRPGAAAFAPARPASQAGHLGGQARLIDENEPFRIEIGLPVEPVPALLQDVRAFLLADFF